MTKKRIEIGPRHDLRKHLREDKRYYNGIIRRYWKDECMKESEELKETVTISKRKYERLIEAYKTLQALENGGVDNWEYYHESLRDAGLINDEDDEDDED